MTRPLGEIVGQWDLLESMPGFGSYWTVITVKPAVTSSNLAGWHSCPTYHVWPVDRDGHELGGKVDSDFRPLTTLEAADDYALYNLTLVEQEARRPRPFTRTDAEAAILSARTGEPVHVLDPKGRP